MSHTDGRKKKKNFSRKWSQTSYRWGRTCCVQSGRCTTWIGVLKIMISKHQLLWLGCKHCREVLMKSTLLILLNKSRTVTRLQSGNNSLWWPTWDIQFNLCPLGVTLHPFVVIFIHFLWLCCCFVSICRHFASHTSKNAAINSRNGKNSLQRLWWPTRDIHMTRHKTLSLWAYYWLCAVHLVVKLHCMYLCSTLCTFTGRSVC